jgi:hypothetical protein
MDVRRIRALLAAKRIDVTSSHVRIEPREDQCAAWLSGGRMAWFPINASGLQRLHTERRVLERLVSRCSFRVPCVPHVSEAGWLVRSLLSGVCEPWTLYQPLQGEHALAKKIGHSDSGHSGTGQKPKPSRVDKRWAWIWIRSYTPCERYAKPAVAEPYTR